MKKYSFYILLILALTSVISCKNKNTEKKEVTTEEKGYTVEPKTTTINWIAYKTTSKTPVKGQFTKLNILEHKANAKTALEALNNLKFSIPTSSLFTKDTIRDGKLKQYFFGKMLNTENITGTIHINNETSGTVDIAMNGITQALPITFVTSDQMVTIEAVMDLDNWKAQAAIEALNTVCKELHTGADGISKTWSEVKIEVATYVKYE